MKSYIASAATALVLASAHVSSAQSVSASNPETLTKLLGESGYPTEIVTDSYGDPQIKTEMEGTKVDINFYGCDDGRNCRDIQFRASFQTSGNVSMRTLHDWNRDFYLGKAYENNEGLAVIEHAVAGVDGMSRYTFERILSRWNNAVDSFKEHIGF
jgi:hypothetical protein